MTSRDGMARTRETATLSTTAKTRQPWKSCTNDVDDDDDDHDDVVGGAYIYIHT